MKFKVLVILHFVAISALANVQYSVIKISGKPTSLSSENNNWLALKVGDQISDEGEVRLGASDYLLIASNQGILEFNIKGSYVLKEYSGKLKSFDDLALDWQNIAFDSLKANTPKRTTLYKKSPIDAQTDADLLSVYPSPTVIYESEIELKWRPMDNNVYVVTLSYNDDNIYFYREVNGDHLKIDLFELQLPNDRCLDWTVQVKGSEYKSKPKCLYILNISETSNIELPRYQLQNQLNLDKSAIHNLMMALFYEDNKIMYKAEEHYEMALGLANNDKRYQQIYYNFLDRRNKVTID